MTQTKIAILSYPNCSQSAVYGCEEMFLMANDVIQEELFNCHVLVWPFDSELNSHFDCIILPPSRNSEFVYSTPENLLIWLKQQYEQGCILCSACVGAFILAQTDLLDNKAITTHWNLADKLKAQYPHLDVQAEKILINENSIITAGGMMAWLDLGLELIRLFCSAEVMRQTGKRLVIDTGAREQRFYQSFIPNYQHGDKLTLRMQHYLDQHFQDNINLQQLAQLVNLTERSVQRRFLKYLQMTPIHYLQRLRVQKVCHLLESTSQPFETIAYKVGYNDVSGCRKTFTKFIGLSPSEFRKRFAQ